MSSGDQDKGSVTLPDQPAEEQGAESEAPAPKKLDLDVQVQDVGPCKKHVKISIPRTEIERQFEESLGSVQRDAQMPGFRPGRAPRQLVVKRYRKEVSDQVKTTLLMGALEQVDRDYDLNPITQPNLDLGAIVLPEDGPLSFEMDVEVRPDFPVPAYQGLKVKRPIKTIRDSDIESSLNRFLERHAQLVPKLDGAAGIGDQLTANLTFMKPDGNVLNEVKEIQFRLQPELRFQDGHIPEIGKALTGIKPGESREVEAKLGTSIADPELRGQTVKVNVEVNDLKHLRLPELNQEFLTSIGFESLDELRNAIRDALTRRYGSLQKQSIRSQILDQMISSTPFDLPGELVSRQEKSTIRRLVTELRQEGHSDSEIRAREAEIRANAHETTLRSLKEFFLLAKVADSVDLKVEADDLDMEIEALAFQSGESSRRLRARLQKEGLDDTLATQILERKALDHILKTVEYEDVAIDEPEAVVETVDHSASPDAAKESTDES